MKIKVGNDIVQIKRIANLKKESLNKIFHKTELSQSKSKPETLAGIFAAKEACKKVFNDLDWLDIEIKKKKNGKPILILNYQPTDAMGHDLSISHDGDYATAIVVFTINK